jgi:hypothetical protein
MPEITVSWDASTTPGASYNVYRGTAPGNEAKTPYVTGVPNAPVLALSMVGASIGGGATYTGQITGGDNNAYEGLIFNVTGFNNAGNNGKLACLSSSATTLVLKNSAAVAETVAATAQSRPYYIDQAVLPGHIYSYEVTSVVSGVESLDSVEVLSAPVPFDPTPSAVSIGGASSFAVLAGSTVTNTGASIIGGDVGVSPGTSLTGFGPPAMESGVLHSADFVSAGGQTALAIAFANAMASPGAVTLTADLGGQTLTPGVYSVASSLAITGTLVLDAQGNPDAVWIFQIGSTLTTAVNNSDVLLLNGAQAQNVFWAVGSSATLNGGTNFVGTIMAQASITVGAGVNVNGRLLAMSGAVTLDADTVQMFLSAQLGVYASNTRFEIGTIIYDCAANTYQQVAVAGITGASRPAFQTAIGATTHDGSVIWVSLDPPLVVVTTGLPPSPPNVAPTPPAGPTNPSIASET